MTAPDPRVDAALEVIRPGWRGDPLPYQDAMRSRIARALAAADALIASVTPAPGTVVVRAAIACERARYEGADDFMHVAGWLGGSDKDMMQEACNSLMGENPIPAGFVNITVPIPVIPEIVATVEEQSP